MEANEINYLYRPEFGNEADIARLIEQHRVYVQVVKLFSDVFHPNGDETVLDIGCGPGSWALDVAFKYQDMSIIGLDIDESAVSYAMMRAMTEHLENVSFEVHDATQRLPFGDESVDYINVSLVNSFLLKEQWPRLFAECYRILRPGGWLRSIEWFLNQSNSPAMRRGTRLLNQALEKDGKRYLELAPVLRPLLNKAGFVATPLSVHAVDFSEDAAAHRPLCEDIYVGTHLALPFIVKQDIASKEEVKQVIEEMQSDMMLPGFYGVILLTAIAAQKPR